MRPLFHVRADAASKIRQRWQRPGEKPQLVSLVAELEDQPPTMDSGHSVEAVVETGKQYFESLASPARCRWVIAPFDAERVPKSDVHEVDGVLFALPDETIALIGTRSLILDGEELRFDPELEAFEYRFKDRTTG